MLLIQKITAIETIPVRHPVLRPGKSIESCHFEGDDFETTHHFGLYLHNDLVAVASLWENSHPFFASKRQFQIRGMAVLENHRKKGYGEMLVRHVEWHLEKETKKLIWFNARATAVEFYAKLGYATVGTAFEIAGVGAHYLMVKGSIPQ